MSSILTFSNRSVKLFTLKNRFLITAKALHSIRMCLTVQVVWQVKHCGCGSCFKMKEWVSLVWPIRNRDITIYSLLDFLDAGLHFPKVGWIWKSLLWMLLLHCCCHKNAEDILADESKDKMQPVLPKNEISTGIRHGSLVYA